MQQLELDFYNTIHSETNVLDKAIKTCKKQGEIILQIFKTYNKPLTPTMVYTIYKRYYAEILLTSVRRSITDLTNKGWLEKLQKQAPGIYGKKNYMWQIKNN
jgi:Fe2+ or Zn2+ uptake regulation protein